MKVKNELLLLLKKHLWRAWFGLTPEEHTALLIIIFLFLFGLCVRYYRTREQQAVATAPSIAAAAAQSEIGNRLAQGDTSHE